jgi:uncharacterized protein involved in exopolysaccharide biosynthesis
MLDTYSAQELAPYGDPERVDDRGQSFELSHFIDILKRRVLYFFIPFFVIATVGAVITKAQPPMYRAVGEVLLESGEISPDLAHFTMREQFDERLEVFKQRIMAGSNLIEIIQKYNLFPDERKSLSDFRLLDLMRARIQLKPLPLQTTANTPTTALSVSFDYEAPDVTVKVVNDFLTKMLSEDAGRRTSSAAETTKLLEKEVKRLQEEHDTLSARIADAKQQPPDQHQTVSETMQTQMKALAELESQLVQKSSTYSDDYPAIKNLKRNIAALKRAIAAAPQATAAETASQPDLTPDVSRRAQINVEKDLDDATNKLSSARIAETIERNQQAEHLRIIQSPELPYKPIGPKKLQWLAITIALAVLVGGGAVFLAEKLDGSIRRSQELAQVIDTHLIVPIPCLLTPEEEQRRRRRFLLLSGVLLVAFAVVLLGVLLTPKIDIVNLTDLASMLSPSR